MGPTNAILFLMLLVNVISWDCGGTKDEIQNGPNHSRRLVTRSSTLAPIRLFYYYQNFDLGSTEANSYFQTTVIDAMDNFLTHALKVYSVEGPLSLSGYSNCGSEITIPSEHLNPGVENTDIIIYITTNNLPDVTYAAYAGACLLDETYENVKAGRVVINTVNSANLEFGEFFSLITHEVTHLLGFASGLYGYWKNSVGENYDPSELTETLTLRDATKTILKTPNVVAKIQEVFNCNTLTGLELEDQGGEGTVGSHWEMRTMFNDYMIAHIQNITIFSTITLALLKDTGWYDVDYSAGTDPVFARNIGCEFFDTKCLTNGVSNYPDLFCDAAVDFDCDPMRLYKSICNIATYSSVLPTAFQYFSTNTIGGADEYTDYCPFKWGYSNGSCRGNSAVTYIIPECSEVIGINSRCFKSNLVIDTFTLSEPYTACYPVISCSSTSATVQIGSQTIECPFTGAVLTVPGYTGTITCPSSDILCSDVPCKNLCAGSGKCISGYCECYSGFSGDDCTIVCGDQCSTCNSVDCLTCNDLSMIISGANCFCPSGTFVDTDGTCSVCPDLCTECTVDTCTSCSTNYSLNAGVCVAACPDAMYSLNGVCTSCPSFCVYCESANCSICADGYYLEGGECIPCSKNCNLCNSASGCTECSSGNTLTEGYCCTNNCKTCSNGVCYNCSTGYSLLGEICYSCLSVVCTACKGGLTLSSGVCI